MSKTKLWLNHLIAAVITGGSSTALASLGISGASMVGLDIKPLDFKQLGAVALGGAVVGLLAYLKQSPIPPTDENTP
jgi:hypothetical protein